MSLNEKLKKNSLTIGSWITIAHPSIVDVMSSGGFEWLVVDIEHTSIGLDSLHILISQIQANDIKAFVRVSKNEEVIIKKVLDIGADGIVVPMINNREDAERAINYAKYPPEGKRGVGLFRAQKYGLGFEEYKKWVKDDLIVIAQIEHIDAVNNVESILQVNDLNGLMVGPYDLSASLGCPGEYEKDIVKEAMKKIVIASKKFDKALGFHVVEPESKKLIDKIKQGYTLLAFGVDFLYLGEMARGEMRIVSEFLKNHQE